MTGNTQLLGLALPVDGGLDGTWGDVVNDSITSLVDSAIAGTTNLSADSDVTLTTTVLAANQARQAIIRWTASNGATTRNITAPAQSKPYIVINAGTGSIVLRGNGSPPTTGITIVAGERCLAAWSGSDFVKVATSAITAGTVTSVGGTGTVNGISLSGTVTSSGNLTLGGALSGVSLATQVTGTLPIANGGTGETTRQAAMDALAGAVTSGQYLRGNGTDVVMSAIQAADVPTLNQNTTGTADNVTGTVAVANGGTGATSLAANNVILGNGTSAVQVVAPGTNGNVLTSNGTTWQSSTPAGQAYPGAGVAVSTGTAWATSLTAPSGTIVGTTDTQTLTSKRITSRIGTTASTSTLTIDADVTDQYNVTALAVGMTIAAPTGTPTDGQKLIIRILDNGTARALTWNAIFRAVGTILPTTTTVSKTTYVGAVYNVAAVKWDVIGVLTQA
jgi:hypothetical protein